jgi:stage IV sporulation protein FB
LLQLFSSAGYIATGTLFGVPIFIHRALPIICSVTYLIDSYLGLMLAIVFVLVFLHEFGHVFAGKLYGLQTHHVTIHPFGGVATIDSSLNCRQTFIVAFGGPMVNLLLTPILLYLSTINSFFVLVFILNLNLLLFNLLPIIPLDGGVMCCSALEFFLGNRKRSLELALMTSQVFSGSIVVLGCIYLDLVLIIIGISFFLNVQKTLKELKI